MSMVRFRVVKAAHLAVALAALILLGVIVALAVRYVSTAEGAAPVGSFASGSAQTAAIGAGMKIELANEAALGLEEQPEAADGGADSEAGAAWTASAVPSVLIYHTHTREAYRQTADDPYEEVGGRWRTTDSAHNVVRVGAALAEALNGRGVSAVHDATDHEQDGYENAYARSLDTLLGYEQPFDLYIDLHRDAYGTEPEEAVTVSVGQQRLARLMVMVGTGDDFDVRPDSLENYQFAAGLTAQINAAAPGLCRDVLVRDKRYNQHIGRCILLEVGHNLNTLEEALATVPYLADALAQMLAPSEEI